MFLWSYHRKKHCGRNRIDHGCPCKMESTLVSLYSSEITCYCSWFLEYKLTRMNSVPHGCSWWILYITHLVKNIHGFFYSFPCPHLQLWQYFFISSLKKFHSFLKYSYFEILPKNPRLRSWVDLKVKVLLWVQHHMEWYHFCLVPIGQPIPKIWLFQDLTLKI